VHAHVQRLVSVVKMATVLEQCTTKEQRSVVRLSRAKGLNVININKEMFPVYGEECSSCNAVCKLGREILSRASESCRWWATSLPCWDCDRTKDFYAAGFDALVKWLDKCINAGGGHVKKQKFFSQARISHVLRFTSICDLFTNSPSYFNHLAEARQIPIDFV
jgi:hypothetical protein